MSVQRGESMIVHCVKFQRLECVVDLDDILAGLNLIVHDVWLRSSLQAARFRVPRKSTQSNINASEAIGEPTAWLLT